MYSLGLELNDTSINLILDTRKERRQLTMRLLVALPLRPTLSIFVVGNRLNGGGTVPPSSK